MGLLGWLKGGGSNPLAHDGALTAAGAKSSCAMFPGASSDFRLVVEDVFTITGRGTVVTGAVESGTISKGANVIVDRLDGTQPRFTIQGIEAFRKVMDSATAGENVGLLLGGKGARDLTRGDVVRAA